jgi:phospholipase/carboxylesterase
MSDTYHYAEIAAAPGAPLFFLFHGTGGNETNLLGLGQRLLPGAHLISPRGDVSEGGALRFFKRTGEGVYDMADFARATSKMTAFIEAQIAASQPSAVLALGYSNGANILASVLFARPDLIDGAVLMHPLIPFEPSAQPGLAGKAILITAGRNDPICPAPLSERLGSYFSSQGAAIESAWHDGGHEIRPEELAAVQTFVGKLSV